MKSSLSLESPDWKKMVSNNWIFDVNKCVIALLLQLQHISRDFRLGNSLHYLYAMWKCSCLYSAWEMTFTQYFMEFGYPKVILEWKRGGLITSKLKKVGQSLKKMPPQSRSRAVVRSGYFLVFAKSTHIEIVIICVFKQM